MLRAAVCASLLCASSPAFAQDCADPALSLAAADLLAGDTREPGALARTHGSTLPAVRGLRVRDGDDARVQRFLDAIDDAAGAPVVCGAASSEGTRLVLAGVRASLLTVDDGVARVELASGWTEPRLYVRDGAGHAHERAFERGRAALPPDLRPPLRIQVVARGPEGPRPVAQRTLGEAAPTTIARSDEPLAVRIAHLRESAGVGPLRPNRLLARVARRHAAEVCRSGRVAHLGDGGDPVARLRREGVNARHVGETAARAADVQAAYAATLRSPSHRAALEDRRMTDVGVGVAEGRCLVVLLAAWPRAF